MKKRSKKTAHIHKHCVACGICMSGCPLSAITIPLGITAVVDEGLCVGCGKCAKVCPASVITMVPREAAV